MENKKPMVGPVMQMRMEPGGMYGIMEQRQILTPPVANAVEDAVPLRQASERRLSQGELGALRNYLSAQSRDQPYSDSQVIEYMTRQGYTINQRQLGIARLILED